MTARLTALDLFAGTGWGVACRWLGIDEVGVELMPEARATREANGMRNWLADVWDVLENAPVDSPEFRAALLIASPPCQTFSMAGKGKGREALDEVLGLIDAGAYRDPAKLRAFGEKHDPRTALVLTPLTYVAQHAPMYVVLEQVPPVLPVWERMATELREWGYSVATGILKAEQYGVPQTRRRAILIARADGVEAQMPTPTHSEYRKGKPMDQGVLPYVTMAEALGWGVGPGEVSVRTSMGEPKVDGVNGTHELDPATRPMHTVTGKSGESRIMRSNYGTGGDPAARGERAADEPAPTMTSKADRNRWINEPHDWAFEGHQYLDRKSQTKPNKRQRRDASAPAPTLTSGSRSANWINEPHDWPFEKPSSTLVGTHNPDIIAGPGGSGVRPTDVSRHRQDRPGSVRVTIEEAAALQSYPADFDWTTGPNGKPLTKTKAFLQVGNAVPPLLAKAILSTLLED